MASDSAGGLTTGFQPTIGQQEVTKITTIHDVILYSATGAVGMAQLLIYKIGVAWNEAFFKNATPPEAMHRIGTAIADVVKVYSQNAQALQQIGGLGGAFVSRSWQCPSKINLAYFNSTTLEHPNRPRRNCHSSHLAAVN